MQKAFTLIVGSLSLIIGLLLVNHRVSKIRSGIVTKATVLRVESKKDGEDMLYRPVLRFINRNNKPMNYTPPYRVPDWHIGETVKIFYRNDNYDEISVLSYWRDFGIALIFFCVGFVSLLIALGEYLVGRFFKTLNLPTPVS
jgi:hypothetical protein